MTMRIDRRRARRRVNLAAVDVPAVLRALGLEFEDRGEGELYARCPNPEHPDSNPSWHIHSGSDSRNGVFFCWSCKWSGNIFTLVATVKGCAMGEAARFVAEHAREEVSIGEPAGPEDYERSLRAVEPPEIGLEWKGRRIEARPVEWGSEAAEYLRRRMIGMAYVQKFSMLDWKERRRVIVPITRGGRMISWIARSYVGGKPKTLAPRNAPKRWELFGYDQLGFGPVVSICEGWADQIRLAQAGRPNPVALCGSRVSEQQAESLARFKRFEVWPDGDTAGEGLVRDLRAWLGRGREFVVFRVPDRKDPSDLHPAEIAVIAKGGR